MIKKVYEMAQMAVSSFLLLFVPEVNKIRAIGQLKGVGCLAVYPWIMRKEGAIGSETTKERAAVEIENRTRRI